MNELATGLRIYDTLIKQKRFTYQCRKGIKHREYQIASACNVPPFQFRRPTSPQDVINVTLVCVDTEEETLLNTECPDLTDSITIETVGLYDYVTYNADHDCCDLPKGLYYLKIDDTDADWFSELFWIDPTAEDLEEFYRIWAAGQIRSIDDLDDRIWQTN